MSVTIRYGGGLVKNLDLLKRRIGPRIEAGCRAAGDVLLEKANELCPKDTRALVDSGNNRKKSGGLNCEFIVGYGSENFVVPVELYGKDRNERPPHEYAVYVHETQIHFLQIPCETAIGEMQAALRKGAGVG